MSARRNVWVWLATVLGLGFAPVAQGTFATLAAVPLAWAMQFLPWQWQLTAVLGLVVVATPICHFAARRLESSDPEVVVLDEVLGFLLACVALPPGLIWLLVALVLFRLLDIFKPGLIGRVERIRHRGVAIMADDLLAGAVCWFLVQIGALAWGLFGGGA